MHNKFSISIIAFLILRLLLPPLEAQNVNYTQYHLAPAQSNPAMISMSNQTRVIFNYRNQFIGAGTSFETPMVSFIYPWIKNRVDKKAAFGLSFLQDKTGENGLLSTTGGLLTAAYNLEFGKNSLATDSTGNTLKKYLSFGLQGGFFQRRINESAFSSGLQWDGTQFVPGSPVGEPGIDEGLFNTSAGFPLINAGLMYYMSDNCGRPKMYVGLSAQNINRPNTGFYDDESILNMQYTAMAAYRFNVAPQVSIMPNARWVSFGGSNEIRFGSMAYYDFGDGEGFVGEGNVGLGLWYDSNTDMALSLEVNQPKYSLGFSYDLGAFADQKDLGSGAWELSLGIKFGKRCIEDRKPVIQDLIRDTTQVEVRQELGDSIYTIVATIEGREVLSTDTINREFVYREVNELLIPTEDDLKIFKRKAFFYYISDDINKASAALLDEIVSLMRRFKGVRIKLNGHTCNIGNTEDDNQQLSMRRAEAVLNYLKKKGISEDRVKLGAFGSSRPILSNKTEYGRIKNRRVEFEVLSIGDEEND